MPAHRVYIGTYTDPSRQAGRPVTPEAPIMGMTGLTGSEGIYVYEQDPESGVLTHLHTVSGVVNPSFLALDADERRLYAVNETVDLEAGAGGGASSFAIDADSGMLTALSVQVTGGGMPCHLLVHPSGRYLIVANYADGRVSVLPIDADGRLAPPTDVRQHEARPSTGRPPHAHFVTMDPAQRHLYVADVGLDRVMIYRLDATSGTLQTNAPPWGETHPGAGPRHIAFHPTRPYLYTNGETDLTLTVFRHDPETGALHHLQYASTIPEGASGRFSTAQMLVHPNGRFAYVANRGHDTIGVFAIDEETGHSTRIANEPTLGKTPRNFAIDPQGHFLYAANQNSDTIVCFQIDADTGRLTATGHTIAVPAPTCVLFTRL